VAAALTKDRDLLKLVSRRHLYERGVARSTHCQMVGPREVCVPRIVPPFAIALILAVQNETVKILVRAQKDIAIDSYWRIPAIVFRHNATEPRNHEMPKFTSFLAIARTFLASTVCFARIFVVRRLRYKSAVIGCCTIRSITCFTPVMLSAATRIALRSASVRTTPVSSTTPPSTLTFTSLICAQG